jgi:hypothetical protein
MAVGKAEEDFELLKNMAAHIGLDDTESDSFISSAMKRIGHKPVMQWMDNDNDDNDNGGSGDFFASRRREQRETRPASGGNRRGRSSGDWQYRNAAG